MIDNEIFKLSSGWHKFKSKSFSVKDNKFTIRVSANGDNNRLSPNDNREAKFLIKNLHLNRNENFK